MVAIMENATLATESLRKDVKRVVCKASHDHVSVIPHVSTRRQMLLSAPIVGVVAQDVKPRSERRWA